MNGSIVSVSYDWTLRRYKKSTYECVQIIKNVRCCWCNALEKLNNHTVLVGGNGVLYIVDIDSSVLYTADTDSAPFAFDIDSSEIRRSCDIRRFLLCFKVVRNDLVLFGNNKGLICCYNPTSNRIISKSKFHNGAINCLIEAEDNKIISCSQDKTIKYMTII